MGTWVDSLSYMIETARVPAMMANRGPLIVMYHGIGGADGVSAADFRAQMALLRSRRRVVPLIELSNRLEDPTATDLAAVTFDDGYVDFAELALPILADAGLHATLFVPAGRVGGTNEWDAGVMHERRILDAAGLRRLDPRHVEIGGHGFSHCRIVGLRGAGLERETAGSRRVLEDLTGRPIRLFAYPYGQRGDFDRAAEHAVEAAGFELACSTCFGRSSRESERYRLRRVGIEPGDDLDVVAGKLDGAYDWVAWKEALGHRLRELRAWPHRGARNPSSSKQ